MTQSQTSLNAKSREVRQAANVYLRANAFLNILRGHLDDVTKADFTALRNMALDGDVEGAGEALNAILTQKGAHHGF